MFDYVVEYTTEINQPIEYVWDFTLNPENWLKNNTALESFRLESPIKAGSVVELKFKDKNKNYNFVFQEVETLEKVKTLLKSTNFKHESTTQFFRVSAHKTRVVENITVSGWLIPFVKPTVKKHLQEIHDLYIKNLAK